VQALTDATLCTAVRTAPRGAKIGQLYHCLQHRKLFHEHTAFPAELAAAA
jgi:hypothetical protein